MRLIVLLSLFVVHSFAVGAIAEVPRRPVLVQSRASIQHLRELEQREGPCVLIMDMKGKFGASMLHKLVSGDVLASVDLFDKPFVLVGTRLIRNSVLDLKPFLRGDSVNKTLIKKYVFNSSSELITVLEEIQKRRKSGEIGSDQDIFIVLSPPSFRRLSMVVLSRWCDKAWRSSLRCLRRYKWTAITTATCLTGGGVGYGLYQYYQSDGYQHEQLRRKGWETEDEYALLLRASSNESRSIEMTLRELTGVQRRASAPYLALEGELPASQSACQYCDERPTCRFSQDVDERMPFCAACRADDALKNWVLNGGSEENPIYPTRIAPHINRGPCVTASDLRNLGASIAEVRRYRRNVLKHTIPSLGACPNCGHLSHKGVRVSGRVFDCEVCERAFCSTCGQRPHATYACPDSLNPEEVVDADLRRAEDPQRIPIRHNTDGRILNDPNHPFNHDDRPCYHCGYMQNRMSACNHVLCPKCRRQWNWVYGEDNRVPPGHSPIYCIGPKRYTLPLSLKAWREGMTNPNDTAAKRTRNALDINSPLR